MVFAEYAYSPNFIRKALEHTALNLPSFALSYLHDARRLYHSESEAEAKERRSFVQSGRRLIADTVWRVVCDRFEGECSVGKPRVEAANVHQILGGERSVEIILCACVDHNHCIDEWRIWFGMIYELDGWDVLVELLAGIYSPLLAMVSSRIDAVEMHSDTADHIYWDEYRKPQSASRLADSSAPRRTFHDKENWTSSDISLPEPLPLSPTLSRNFPRAVDCPPTLLERIDGALNSRAGEDPHSLLSRVGPKPELDPRGPCGLLIRMGLSSPGGSLAVVRTLKSRRRRRQK